jgi:hypothetical protein
MRGDRARDLVAPARHGQAFRIADLRDGVRCDRRARRTFATRRALAVGRARSRRGRLARIAAPFVVARRLAALPRLLLPARLLTRIGCTVRVLRRVRVGPRRRGTFRYIRHGGAL